MKSPMLRSAISALVAFALVFGTVTIAPTRTSAASLSTAIIGMFPKSVGEFSYADLKAARKFPWFSQLYGQVLPPKFRQFEQFLGSSGVDPNSQVEEIAWANVSSGSTDDVVGVALGQFDPASVETKLKAQKVPSFEVQGYHLYAFGSGAAAGDILFVFFDSSTAAFGNRTVLEHLINVRMGGEETLLTGKLFPLISEANGNGIIWAVLDKDHTHLAMQQLVPQAGQFPQATAIIGRLHAMIININADSGVDAHFQAVCDSVDDANLLGAAMQAGIMYRRYQEAQGNPSLAKTLDQVKVTPAGDRLKIEAPVSQEELLSLIQTKAFAAPM
ncbi:MAG TPA: hypothetical protein VN902_11395 [Candidatus Acidoferrales bacterium]|nr:hypothetical protein [Candidatus Acidoferrales bacterium]